MSNRRQVEIICKWLEWRRNRIRDKIFRLIHQLDVLDLGTFMAMSHTEDSRTTYHVIAERHLDNCHKYGTKIEYYNKEDARRDNGG